MSTPEKELKQPAEAGFSTNLYLNNEKSGRVQFTFRGAFSSDWRTVMAEVHDFIASMREQGWLMDGEARAAGIEAPAAPAGDKKPFVQKPVPANEVPPELPGPAEGGTDYFRDEFDYFVIEPKPDNKATVKFYKDKLKFPVGAPINNWKAERVVEALAALAEVDPDKAATVRVAGVQFWTHGNEYTNQKGEKARYKDFRLAQRTL